ncbi:MAG: glutamine--fructose-6-phosphate transaminase (isomerizing) [Patescibacteria group bacterium]
MCGITGYIGPKDSLQTAFANLSKLEYRGYDSAGAAFFDESGLRVIKAAGKLENLQSEIRHLKSTPNTVAIAHTRWATHGLPNEINAHPHCDCYGNVVLVHNGIIENYRELKVVLSKKGHKFKTQTDTEVIAHLIEEKTKKESDFASALKLALKDIRGAYALLVINKSEPQKLYVARLGSPMVIGIGAREFFVASDPTALAGLAPRVMYLKDGQSGWLTVDGYEIGPKRPKIEKLDLTAEQAKKGKYPHFMLKEIYEIPEIVRAAMLGRLKLPHTVKLGGLDMLYKKLRGIKRLEIVGCGTSYYAGMIGELLIEELTNIPTELAIASEFRYSRCPLQRNTAWLFISQSGETADTLAALRKVNAKRFQSLGIVNVVGSTIARETKAGVYNRAGPEIGVASTKAFLSQLTILALMALYLAPNKSGKTVQGIIQELDRIPNKIKLALKLSDQIKDLAEKYQQYNNFLYLGRGYNYPTALEGALKIKELAYVHAEGYASGEMKHGPIALINESFPTVAIVTQNRLYEKNLSSIEEIKARSGRVLAIATRGDKVISKLADDVIYVPKTVEQLESIVNVIPLQLFAYHFAVQRGYDVDKPRNLAKSVTVE